MDWIIWDDSMLSIGIAEIDSQHKLLIELLNNLNEGIRNGQGMDILQDTINGLLNYVEDHFKAEEALMEKHEYPLVDNHKNLHKEFVEKLNTFTQEYEDKRMFVSIDIRNFLRDWLIKHISTIDKQMGIYLSSRQLLSDN
jgi:methyl-accepting chemotaxis protein/hemerythrin